MIPRSIRQVGVAVRDAHPRPFRLRRPVALRALPGHPPRARPRRTRGLADGTARRRLRRRAGRGAARARRARLLLRRARRLLPPHARGRGHLARPRARARRDRAAEHRRRGRHLRQDARRRHARRLHGRLRVRAARRRHRRGRARAAAALLAAARGDPSGRRRARGLELARGARRVHPLRAAPCARAVDRVAGARRRGARHPWLRLNDQSLVQLGHGKYQQRIQATVTGRTSHIAVELASDKEETNKILAHARPAGAEAGARAERGPGRARRAAHRLPGRDQALQRQPRPRHLDPPHDRRGSGAGLRRRRASTRAR